MHGIFQKIDQVDIQDIPPPYKSWDEIQQVRKTIQYSLLVGTVYRIISHLFQADSLQSRQPLLAHNPKLSHWLLNNLRSSIVLHPSVSPSLSLLGTSEVDLSPFFSCAPSGKSSIPSKAITKGDTDGELHLLDPPPFPHSRRHYQ